MMWEESVLRQKGVTELRVGDVIFTPLISMDEEDSVIEAAKLIGREGCVFRSCEATGRSVIVHNAKSNQMWGFL